MKVFVSTNKKRGWIGCEDCAKTAGFKEEGRIALRACKRTLLEEMNA